MNRGWGLLDLTAPVFDAIDGVLAALMLPAALRVMLYAAVCAWFSMLLYKRCSNQARILEVRAEIARTQAALATHDGAFGELNQLILKNLKLTLRQLGMTLRPALIATLPLPFFLAWLSNAFALAPPTGPVHICAEPPQAAATLHWEPGNPAAEAGCWNVALPAAVGDAARMPLLQLPARPQSEFVHKFIALNRLVGNPNGYLPDDVHVERLTLALAPRELLPFGPATLRGWEPLFFLTLLVLSLWLRWRWRVV